MSACIDSGFDVVCPNNPTERLGHSTATLNAAAGNAPYPTTANISVLRA